MIRTSLSSVLGLSALLLSAGLCVGCGEAAPENEVEMAEKEMMVDDGTVVKEMDVENEEMAEKDSGGSGSK